LLLSFYDVLFYHLLVLYSIILVNFLDSNTLGII